MARRIGAGGSASRRLISSELSSERLVARAARRISISQRIEQSDADHININQTPGPGARVRAVASVTYARSLACSSSKIDEGPPGSPASAPRARLEAAE